jgi:hypothetical protein
VISKFPEVSRLRDSMAREHPEVLSGDIVDSVVSQGHCATRVSSRWLVACCSVVLQPHSFYSNIHEYVQLTVKKLLVVNLEPIAAKIRYGFEAATVCAPPSMPAAAQHQRFAGAHASQAPHRTASAAGA